MGEDDELEILKECIVENVLEIVGARDEIEGDGARFGFIHVCVGRIYFLQVNYARK